MSAAATRSAALSAALLSRRKAVDEWGLYCFVLQVQPKTLQTTGGTPQISQKVLIVARYPTSREPPGFAREKGKRPDGQAMIPSVKERLLITISLVKIRWRSKKSHFLFVEAVKPQKESVIFWIDYILLFFCCP